MYEGVQLYQCKSADLILFPAGILQVWSFCFGPVHLLSHSPRHPAAVALQTVSSISIPIGTMAARSPTPTPLSAIHFGLATWRNNSHPFHTDKGRFLMISWRSAQPYMGAAGIGRRRLVGPCSQSPEGRSGASAHRALVHVQVLPACECGGVLLWPLHVHDWPAELSTLLVHDLPSELSQCIAEYAVFQVDSLKAAAVV